MNEEQEDFQTEPIRVRFRKKDSNHDIGDIASFSPAKAAVLVRAGVVQYVDKRLALRLKFRTIWRWLRHPLDSIRNWYRPPVYTNFEDGVYEIVHYRSKLAIRLSDLATWFQDHGRTFSREVGVGVIVALIAAMILALLGLG